MRIFDSHFHITDYDYDIKGNNGYMPPSFTANDYQQQSTKLNIAGGAIVSGSFQGYDQQYLVDALQTLGKGYCGVTQLPVTTTDEEIVNLHKQGVRALRFNVQRGGLEDLSQLKYFAQRVYDLVGWHSELYIDSTKLPQIMPTIEQLPAVSIDHLGLSKAGVKHLLSLVDKGVHVKATGFGRVDLDVAKTMQSIYNINSGALMFGTDLPSTRAPRPFLEQDIELIKQSFDDTACEKILWQNAMDFYKLSK